MIPGFAEVQGSFIVFLLSTCCQHDNSSTETQCLSSIASSADQGTLSRMATSYIIYALTMPLACYGYWIYQNRRHR